MHRAEPRPRRPRNRLARLLAALVVATGLAGAAEAREAVDLELVLLADASGSIDTAEIMFQRQGYAAALNHPRVLNAIAGGFLRRIAVAYVEWGDARSQAVVVPWTVIDGPESAAAFARALLAKPRLASGRNAIGSAIAFAHALIRANEIDGTRRIIDISADSANSWGGVPDLRRQGARARGRDHHQRAGDPVPRRMRRPAGPLRRRESLRRDHRRAGPAVSSSPPTAATASPRVCAAS